MNSGSAAFGSAAPAQRSAPAAGCVRGAGTLPDTGTPPGRGAERTEMHELQSWAGPDMEMYPKALLLEINTLWDEISEELVFEH